MFLLGLIWLSDLRIGKLAVIMSAIVEMGA